MKWWLKRLNLMIHMQQSNRMKLFLLLIYKLLHSFVWYSSWSIVLRYAVWKFYIQTLLHFDSIEINSWVFFFFFVFDYYLYLITVYSISNSNSLNFNSKNKCDILRNEFANAISDLERCAIQKAVPVTLCSDCLNLYITNLQSFRELIGTQDDNNVRMNCGDHFIDQNSLNILYKRYMSSRDLWNSGHCTSKSFQYF